MGRFPRLSYSALDLEPVDAIYLTHAHSDHLDPYTLVRLWRELSEPPVLLLPISLQFLLPVFKEFLDNPEILIIEPHTPCVFRGLELLGFFDVGLEATNEDDVMILVVTNADERVLVEADARLSLEFPNFRQFISMLLRRPGLETAVFLTTENELTGTLEGRSCSDLTERAQIRSRAFEELIEAVEYLYMPVEDPEDLWQGAHVLRLIHGQGLTAPHELDSRWQQILFPVRIHDRVHIERKLASSYGYAESGGSSGRGPG